MRTQRIALAFASLSFLPATLAAQQPVDQQSRVDEIFSRWTGEATPGCAVGAARGGQPFLTRAYGMADLEHDVRNEPRTIFEAGSVSKQFTAAAVVLLALDGKLALDDDIRKYIPEVPQYEKPVLIRHMLNHTSGLRDWGSVAGISGWGRGSRVHTHDHVLDIVSRQTALNFEPGHEYSYSNTGYNLLAILVDRVSGMPFAEFSRQRIFEPLGMTSTSWRDDYTRIVKHRAVAYSARRNGFATDMPYENVHGNGGLLTTVGDLLTWTQNLETGKLGGPRFLELMHETGVLNDGSRITYASGLVVDEHRGVPEVSHTGSTAGYRAFLARYPEQDLAVALLCNVGNVNPGSVGHQVADVLLGDAVRVADAALRNGGGRPDTPERPAHRPDLAQLAEYTGTYHSDDAETTLTIEIGGDGLVALRRPADRLPLMPTAPDAFDSRLGAIRFIRDDGGNVIELSVRQGRVYDMRFQKR
jgi:CubicO group peptidase (beta-lactamase class C family)